MKFKALATIYKFTCDTGKILDKDKAKALLAGYRPSFSKCGQSVRFTAIDDNISEIAMKIRGDLFWCQKEK